MKGGGDGFGLPQASEQGIISDLLCEDESRAQNEPQIASRIGEQMLHMDMVPLPRSIRARIRDICSRIPARNVILVGGGIGHLSAWLFDMWCGSPDGKSEPYGKRPTNLRIIEQGSRFGVIIDRVIRRYNAENWASVISRSWIEVAGESISAILANVATPEAASGTILPHPLELIIVDLPERERVKAASLAFDLISSGGVVLVQEPTVPTGDVGLQEEGQNPTPAQEKVNEFNDWIDLVKNVSKSHSIGFTELTGGTLVALIRK